MTGAPGSHAAGLIPPLLRQLRGYRLGWLRSDFLAGLSVAAVALPTAIAYPAIVNLPPEVGLYAAIFPTMGSITSTPMTT